MKDRRFLAIFLMAFILSVLSGCTSSLPGQQVVPTDPAPSSSEDKTDGSTPPVAGSALPGSPESAVYEYFNDVDAGRYDEAVDAFWLSYMPEVSLSPEHYRSTMIRALEEANGPGGDSVRIRDVTVIGKETYPLTIRNFNGNEAMFQKYGKMDAWNITVSYTQVRTPPTGSTGNRNGAGAAERMTGQVLVVFADGAWKLWPYVG